MIRKIVILGFAALSLAAFPANTGLVTDEAHVLTGDERVNLELTLRKLEQDRSIEFAVVTVNSLDGLTIEDYAEKLFRQWGIGKKGKDNGLLFLIAPHEKKVRFEVGYGLEPVLTDVFTGYVLREKVKPGWRSDHRAKGIFAGVNAVIEKLEQPSAVDPRVIQREPEKSGFPWFWVLLFGIPCVLLVGWFVWEILHEDPPPPPPPDPPRTKFRKTYTYVPPPEPVLPVDPFPRRQTPRRTESSSSNDDYYRPSSPPSSSWDSGSSSGSSSSFDFGGGSSGGGGSSSDL